MQTRSSDQALKNGTIKRKRRSSDYSSNIENGSLQEEKKHKGERFKCNEEEDSSHNDERIPFTELSILQPSFRPDSDVGDKDSDKFLNNFNSPESQYGPLSVDTTPGSSGEIFHNEFNQTTPSKDFDKLLRTSPWPKLLSRLDWANVHEWWDHYITSDAETAQFRNPRVFNNHPGLQPRMRAVLLEWLIEVCDVFKLQRETYYLSLDYLDCYLHHTTNVPKARLQLIGISCLLIASKVEEIYPPKVSEYAFVTDGACTENDILIMERMIMKVLNWKFKSITTNCWVLIYLQLGYMNIRKEKDLDHMHPTYPPDLYITASQLLDLATLDIDSLCYNYSVLAMSALYIVCCEKFPIHISGYQFHEIKECVHWMEAFWAAICEQKSNVSVTLQFPLTKDRPIYDPSHFLQQHVVNMDLLESAQAILSQMRSQSAITLLSSPSSEDKGINEKS